MTSIRNTTSSFLLSILVSVAGASSPYPESPEFPTSTHELRANADERLMISVQSVETDNQKSSACYQRDLVTAVVIATTGANTQFQPLDEVQFYNEVYDLDSPQCAPPEGQTWPYQPPASSPMIDENWCGIAYLNIDEENAQQESQNSPLVLAAFWDSLNQFDGKCPPLPGTATNLNKNGPSTRSGATSRVNSPYPYSPPFPATTHGLRANAQERLMISVQSVETDYQKVFDGSVCYQRDLVTATVIATTGANTQFQPLDEVQFYNEVYDMESKGCAPPQQGQTWPYQPPASSPKIAENWCGIAYLNMDDSIQARAQESESPLILAAHWDSLDQFDGQCPPIVTAGGANRQDNGPFNRHSRGLLRGNRQ